MKRIIIICLFLLPSLIFGFGPPLRRFYIKNSSGERIYLQYVLQEDLIRNFTEEAKLQYSRINRILEDGELIEIKVPASAIYGRISYYDEAGWLPVKNFNSLFQSFKVTTYDSYISLYKEEMKQEYIKYPVYTKGRMSVVDFMLEIPRSAFYPEVAAPRCQTRNFDSVVR